MKHDRIVGLGLCVVDHSYRVEGLAGDGSRLRYVESLRAAGGMTATALRQAAALGCRTQLLSVIGDDEDGSWLARSLRAEGVGIRGLLRSPRCPTTVAVVLVDARSAERRFVVPDRRHLEARAPRLAIDGIDARSLLLIDAHFPRDALRAAKRARRVGARVIADFHRRSAEVEALLPWVDDLIVPLEFFAARPPRTSRAIARTLAGLRAAHGLRPVITAGARGAYFLEGERLGRACARPPGQLVDTTGAGDVFHGAFAAALAQGASDREALEVAAAAGALACSAFGGGGRFMKPEEMKRALRVFRRS